MADKFKKLIAVIIILILAVLLDQGTKIWAENNFASYRYPDHFIEATVTQQEAGSTLEQFVKTKYDSLSEEDAKYVIANARKDGKKIYASDALQADDKVEFNHLTKTVIPGYFDYQYARNPGAAFSFLANQSDSFRQWFFGITGIFAMIALGLFIAKSKWKNQKFLIVSLAVVMGGALGNIIDRFRLSYVIDFISWHVGNHYWPTFNIADVFVCVGIGLLVIDVIKNGGDEDKKKKDKAKAEGKTEATEVADAESGNKAEEAVKTLDDKAENAAEPKLGEAAKTDEPKTETIPA